MNFFKKIFKKYNHAYRDNNIYNLENKIGYNFNNPEILLKAITHKSLLSEPDQNYERLEFLGDAILDRVVSEWLFKNYSKLDEGGLTKKRSSLVNSTFLGMIGKKFSLINHINADPGVDLNDSKVLQNISADVYESIVGAIFLDGGEKNAIKFIYRTLIVYAEKADEDLKYKGSLIEICHKKGLNPPFFELVKSEGPEHNKIFHIKVDLKNGQTYVGTGQSKKHAEQNAAMKALKKI